MSQPPKFILEANWMCECYGCQSRLKNGVRKFQKHIAKTYGLPRSSFNAVSRTVEIIGDVDASKLQELKELLQEFIKNSVNNTTFCGCFGGSKKKRSTASQAQLDEHLKNLSIDNNNANNVSKPENVGRKDQTEANHQQQQQQQQQPEAKSKGKGKMGEDGKGSKRGKEIKFGGTSENMNRRGEASQKNQYPVDETTNESNHIGQYSRGEIAMDDQNDQRGQNARGHIETHYGQTYQTNMYPITQMDQMRGGYYRQPATVAQISPFSDIPTADGSDCCIM